uniref:Uncharacterized protein n=1 Tax=Panagrellus redivivus TaxID=6233 RepID=A0A7E4ZV04_PANRE
MSLNSNGSAVTRFTYDWLIRFAELHPFKLTEYFHKTELETANEKDNTQLPDNVEDFPKGAYDPRRSKYAAVSPLFTNLVTRYMPYLHYDDAFRIENQDLIRFADIILFVMENRELPFFLTFHHYCVYKLKLELEFQETVEQMTLSRIKRNRELIDDAKDQIYMWCTEDNAEQALEDYVKFIQRIRIEIGHDLTYLDCVRNFQKHKILEIEKAEKDLEMH